ncbi:uncharacterized protein LOC131060266 isoform X1 [Cryptomeria japonica]|uniref:uncharacterized protein LOC131060266 isoform X1 n=1 Tax=Cryptomeria japonica TaxID=3369 RepID=UPI0027DA3808|nr:uncharacterized protein LOC131060266 isoform X1 [Cryptomeria japonica]
MEEQINQGDLLGHVVRPPSLRASSSLKATLSGRLTPRSSPSFRRSQSSRTPRKDARIYLSPLQWLRGQRLLPWLVVIGIWSYLGFHVQSKWAHSGANDENQGLTAFGSRVEVDQDLRSHVSVDEIKYQISVIQSNTSGKEQGNDVFKKPENGRQSPVRLKKWFWEGNRGQEQGKLGNDLQQKRSQTLGNSSSSSIYEVHGFKGAAESPPHRISRENVVTERTHNTNDPQVNDATGVEGNNKTPTNIISGTEQMDVKVKRNTSLGLLVGPFDKMENKVLGWNSGKRYGTCNRKGLFANTARGRSFILVLHELSMTGAPLAMMELAAEILSCGGRVSVVALSRKGGLIGELNRRGIKLLKDKSVQSYREAMKSDLVIAGSAVSASWIEQYLLHYKRSSDRLIWWIMENRREYFDRSKNMLHKVKALLFLSESQSQQWLTWCAQEGIKLPPILEVVPLSVNDELAFVAGLQTALNSPLFSTETMLEKRRALREKVRSSMGLDSNDMLVMTLSSINPGKGQLILLKAALMIADENFIPKINPEHVGATKASQNALGGADTIVKSKGNFRVLSEFSDIIEGGGSHSSKSIAIGTRRNQSTASNSTLSNHLDSSHTRILDREQWQVRKLSSNSERNENQTLKLLIGSVGSKSNKVLYIKSMLGLIAHYIKLASLMLWTPATIHVAPLYAAADVYVINAQGIGETFGRVTIEAMAFGLPVLGTEAGGTKEIVEENITGLLHPVGQKGVQILSQNIRFLLDNQSVREEMGRKGREKVEKLYLKHHMYDRLAEILQKCLIYT